MAYFGILVGTLSLCLISAEFKLMELPFSPNALEPFLSELTVSTHYNKHHGGYVKKLNAALGENYEKLTVLDIVHNIDAYSTSIGNLASQIFNHDFYWKCIDANYDASDAEQEPKGISQQLLQNIIASFGSFDAFKTEFISKANKHFGSGWLWLVIDADETALRIREGHDAQCPLSWQDIPLLTIDVWEHAYYLDYKNERARYVNEFFKRINWKFVSDEMAVAGAKSKTDL
mmetsp:Transcript_31747/g.51375  ORF Transcript_31747/g.51375 Transcript_31747/m.51375 type:complete len:231 (-) Transcript_31747:1702-2394(-)